jgi:glycosyltransferase involved in cell wall biosynthesis
MIKNKRVSIIMPAYNAESTLSKTFGQIPENFADYIIIINDGSKDKTERIAKSLEAIVISHNINKGYGAALKTGFLKALELGSDIVVVLHSDNQYDPSLVKLMASIIAENNADVVMASRMLDKKVFRSMPFYRYLANKILTLFQNVMFGRRFSEYQTGYRAYNSNVIKSISIQNNSDSFVFDNELLAQILFKNFKVKEIPCPAKYNEETSSISIRGSLKYFFAVLGVSFSYLLHKANIKKYSILLNSFF